MKSRQSSVRNASDFDRDSMAPQFDPRRISVGSNLIENRRISVGSDFGASSDLDRSQLLQKPTLKNIPSVIKEENEEYELDRQLSTSHDEVLAKSGTEAYRINPMSENLS